jgi:hypothetical protein
MNWKRIIGAVLLVVTAVLALYTIGMTIVLFFFWRTAPETPPNFVIFSVIVSQFLVAGTIGLGWLGLRLLRSPSAPAEKQLAEG